MIYVVFKKYSNGKTYPTNICATKDSAKAIVKRNGANASFKAHSGRWV